MMVPHSIVTVSLATAILPRLSATRPTATGADLGRTLGATLRTALAFVLPFAALLPVLAADVANVLFGSARLATRANASRRRWRCSRPAWSSSPSTT